MQHAGRILKAISGSIFTQPVSCFSFEPALPGGHTASHHFPAWMLMEYFRCRVIYRFNFFFIERL